VGGPGGPREFPARPLWPGRQVGGGARRALRAAGKTALHGTAIIDDG
jgi:hypothetical protein